MFFSNADITIYLCKDEDEYIRIPLKDVYWEETHRNSSASGILVLIPLHSLTLPDIQSPKPEERHYLSRGIIDLVINTADDLHTLIETYRPLTIQDIRRVDQIPGLEHWEVTAI